MRIDIEINDYLDEADTGCLIEELQDRKINVLKYLNTHIAGITETDLINLISRKKRLSVIQAVKLNEFIQTL